MAISTRDAVLSDSTEELVGRIESLRAEVLRSAEAVAERLDALPPARRPSAENLLHYLALRGHDLRPLQERLARAGLDAFDHAEAHVLATLDALLDQLRRSSAPRPVLHEELHSGQVQLEENTAALFGPAPAARRSRIMATTPDEALDDPVLLRRMLDHGMDCLRINCAYGDQERWSQTIAMLRDAEQAAGRPCRLLMDLRGPKLRLGPLQPEPAILKIRPLRAADGKVVKPARIRLVAAGDSAVQDDPGADGCLTVDPQWLQQVSADDCIRLVDARGSRRKWRVTDVDGTGCWVESRKTTYLENGSVLRLLGNDGQGGAKCTVRDLPPRDGVCLLREGDLLFLACGDEPGLPAAHDAAGRLLSPGRLSLPIPELFRGARTGEQVRFDDGRITGVIEHNDGRLMHIRILHTRRPVERLTGYKGVNFPDTAADLPALDEDDLRDLSYVGRNADIIGLSFTNSAADVRDLRRRLQELGCDGAALVVKVETWRGYRNLPSILLEAMQWPACGVMIARGDLAAECGFESLAELQEDILRLCEAAHVPAIWATGVLDGLAKRGHPTRAEITDAADAQRAECVMLGKGACIVEALGLLDRMLGQMQRHQFKQQSLLRALPVTHPAADWSR
jgi:pyruvate kinase